MGSARMGRPPRRKLWAADSAPSAARLDIDYPESLGRRTAFLRLTWIIPILIILALLTPLATRPWSPCAEQGVLLGQRAGGSTSRHAHQVNSPRRIQPSVARLLDPISMPDGEALCNQQRSVDLPGRGRCGVCLAAWPGVWGFLL